MTQLHQRTTQATEAYLTAIIQRRLTAATSLSTDYEFFWKSIDTIIRAGGKRLRPYLTMVGYGEFSDAIIPVAASQEFIHTAMLMHDDVIDQDTIRHGHDNINGIYFKRYKNLLEPQRSMHYAHGSSILSGDALISEAYKSIIDAQLPQTITTKLIDRLHQSIYEVIGGELLDIEAPIVRPKNFDPFIVYRYKTAGYSFIGPLVSGALCAEAPPDTIQILEDYGEYIGIAFQLQDDLLGLFGNENTTGKSSITDLREAKMTQLIIAHKQLMNPSQEQRFNDVFGSPRATAQEFEALKQDIINSGARTQVETITKEYFNRARSAVDRLKDGLTKDELVGFSARLEQRSF